MISRKTRSIKLLVHDIRDGNILLPELQRGYVWKSGQVRDLFDSLYRGYPSGQLLIWETNAIPHTRKLSVDDLQAGRMPQLLLDGQQRLTSLTAIILGQDLLVSNKKRPIDIAFNLHSEKFEVAGPRQRREKGWISLSKLYTQSAMRIWRDLDLSDIDAEEEEVLYKRIERLQDIPKYEYNINVLEEMDYKEVTDIFVRINSGGTKLNSADLTLAQMSVIWRGITEEIAGYQKSLAERYPKLNTNTGVMLRALAAVLSRSTKLDDLFKGETRHLTEQDLQNGWKRAKRGMDQAMAFLANNCLIDRMEFLTSHYIVIVLTAFFDHFDGMVSDQQKRDLQYWVYMAMIWARYSSSSESNANQDIAQFKKDDAIAGMLQNIYDRSGIRKIEARQFLEQRKGSPFETMSYVLAKHARAEDWFNGVGIGADQNLERHHIFPKAILKEKYDLRRDSRTVDQVANIAFLSQRANSKISSSPPSDYLPTIEQDRLKSQVIPMDNDLWERDAFESFTTARRELLATALNELLQSVRGEKALWVTSDSQVIESRIDALELNMRDVVAQTLINARGDTAYQLVPRKIRDSIEWNHQRHLAQNPFETEAQGTLRANLDHALYSHLAKIVKAHWNLFSNIFGTEERFDSEFARITAARNGLKHNRDLNASEKASAEAGLIWVESCIKKALAE